jgi:hypothetical protein
METLGKSLPGIKHKTVMSIVQNSAGKAYLSKFLIINDR